MKYRIKVNFTYAFLLLLNVASRKRKITDVVPFYTVSCFHGTVLPEGIQGRDFSGVLFISLHPPPFSPCSRETFSCTIYVFFFFNSPHPTKQKKFRPPRVRYVGITKTNERTEFDPWRDAHCYLEIFVKLFTRPKEHIARLLHSDIHS